MQQTELPQAGKSTVAKASLCHSVVSGFRVLNVILFAPSPGFVLCLRVPALLSGLCKASGFGLRIVWEFPIGSRKVCEGPYALRYHLLWRWLYTSAASLSALKMAPVQVWFSRVFWGLGCPGPRAWG